MSCCSLPPQESTRPIQGSLQLCELILSDFFNSTDLLTNLIPLTLFYLSLSLALALFLCLFLSVDDFCVSALVLLFSLYFQASVSDLLGSGPGCPLRDSELLQEWQRHQGSHIVTATSHLPSAHTHKHTFCPGRLPRWPSRPSCWAWTLWSSANSAPPSGRTSITTADTNFTNTTTSSMQECLNRGG